MLLNASLYRWGFSGIVDRRPLSAFRVDERVARDGDGGCFTYGRVAGWVNSGHPGPRPAGASTASLRGFFAPARSWAQPLHAIREGARSSPDHRRRRRVTFLGKPTRIVCQLSAEPDCVGIAQVGNSRLLPHHAGAQCGEASGNCACRLALLFARRRLRCGAALELLISPRLRRGTQCTNEMRRCS